MKKKLLSILLAVTLIGTMTMACAKNENESTDNKSEQQTESAADTTSSEDSNVASKGQLIVYSNTDQTGADAMVAVGKEIGIDVNVVMLAGGGEVIDRLIAEKNSPIADVVYGINHIGFARLKAQDLLQQFEPAWADQVEKGLKDPEGYYYGVGMSAILLAYMDEYIGSEIPTDWTQLWTKDAFKGKYFVDPRTSGGTTQLVLSGILSRYRDDQGEYGISDEGWQAIADYYKNAYIKQEGDDFFALLTKGQILMGQTYSGGVVKANADYDADVKWAIPEIGVPFAVEMVGIVNGSKNTDLAKEFLDYYGSAEVMSKVSKSVPTIAEARENVDAEVRAIVDSVTVQEIDYDFVAQNLDRWLEKIELELIP